MVDTPDTTTEEVVKKTKKTKETNTTVTLDDATSVKLAVATKVGDKVYKKGTHKLNEGLKKFGKEYGLQGATFTK